MHMHVEQKKLLLKHYKSSYAWIFTGAKNIGKFLIAKNFANWLLNAKDANNNSSANKKNRDSANIDSSNINTNANWTKQSNNSNNNSNNINGKPKAIFSSPDLLIVNKEKINEKIKIEDIDIIHQFINITSSGARYKIIIINDFENITISAANSLLKLLEEPKQNSLIILVTSSLYKVLATIRSRCFILRFSPQGGKLDLLEGLNFTLSGSIIFDYKQILNTLISGQYSPVESEKNTDSAVFYQLLYLSFSRIVKFKSGLRLEELFPGEITILQKLRHSAIFWCIKFNKVSNLISACNDYYLDKNYLSSIVLNQEI